MCDEERSVNCGELMTHVPVISRCILSFSIRVDSGLNPCLHFLVRGVEKHLVIEVCIWDVGTEEL